MGRITDLFSSLLSKPSADSAFAPQTKPEQGDTETKEKVGKMNGDSQEPEGKGLDDLRKKSEAEPVIRIVDHIVSEAVENGASYILFEPTKGSLQIWHRVDGLLRRAVDLPKWVQDAVNARVKCMANLAIEEKRFLQIGWIGVRVGGRVFDLRVSTLPVRYGEKLIIQILDSADVRTDGDSQ